MKGWRTLLFGAAVALVGVIEAFDWASVIPDKAEGFVLPLIGVAIMYLRKITTTPLGQKDA